MVQTVFLQQLFHMSIIKLFSLVCVQVFWIAHMQGCGHFLTSFSLDGNHESQLRKTVYNGQDKSVGRIISFKFGISDQICLILVLHTPSQNLSPSELCLDSAMKACWGGGEKFITFFSPVIVWNLVLSFHGLSQGYGFGFGVHFTFSFSHDECYKICNGLLPHESTSNLDRVYGRFYTPVCSYMSTLCNTFSLLLTAYSNPHTKCIGES